MESRFRPKVSTQQPRNPSRSHEESPSTPETGTIVSSTSSLVLPDVSICLLTPSTLTHFRRAISLLLPIRYPDKFFNEILSDPSISTLSRVAIWHDRPRCGKRKRKDSSDIATLNIELQPDEEAVVEGHVIGGIRCRLESIPCIPSGPPSTQQQLYIQALALLSPYRGNGVATHLLNQIISSVLSEHNNITSIYAHVWEANTEGLEWYIRRGFVVEDELLEGYYRRLRPSGARVARRAIGVGDYIRAKGRFGNGVASDEKRDSDAAPISAGIISKDMGE